MRIKHYRAASILAAALFTVGITGAQAAVISLNNTVVISNTETTDAIMTWGENDLSIIGGSSETDGVSSYMDSVSVSMSDMPVWDYSWNLTADPDPFIAGTFTVTNTSGTDQTFDITFGLSVSPIFTDGYMTGSLSGSYFDADGDGSAALNLTLWEGLIDGLSEMSLPVFEGTCSSSPPGGCIGTIDDILQGPTLYTGDVNDTIGIHMTFDLSAGDKVTFNTLFEIVPVPVPAAVWLFASGLLGLVGIARKKAHA